MAKSFGMFIIAIVVAAAIPVYANYEMAEMPMGQPMAMGQGGQMMEPMPGYQLPASAGYRSAPLASRRAPAQDSDRGPRMGGPSKLSKIKDPGMASMMPGPCGPPMCMPSVIYQPLTWY
jgi:hypothetical protein